MNRKHVIASALGAGILTTPYVIIRSIDSLYQTGLSFGWEQSLAAFAALFLTLTSIAVAIGCVCFIFDE